MMYNEPIVKNIANLDFEKKILETKRVTKIIKGGKNTTFRTLVVIGDKISRVGLGIGKAEDGNISIEKAVINAKKNIINICLTKNSSIPNIIFLKKKSAKIMLLPAKKGTGIVAGRALKAILELAGINNIIAKQLGSPNILNNASAVIEALLKIKENVLNSNELLTKNNSFYKRNLKKICYESKSFN